MTPAPAMNTGSETLRSSNGVVGQHQADARDGDQGDRQ